MSLKSRGSKESKRAARAALKSARSSRASRLDDIDFDDSEDADEIMDEDQYMDYVQREHESENLFIDDSEDGDNKPAAAGGDDLVDTDDEDEGMDIGKKPSSAKKRRVDSPYTYAYPYERGLEDSFGLELAEMIIPIKNNDPQVTCLSLRDVHLDRSLWTRLGAIIRHNNTHVEKLIVNRSVMAAEYNSRRRYDIDKGGVEKMRILSAFMTNACSLKVIAFTNCNLGYYSLKILSTALSRRRVDSLEELNLQGNNFGDFGLRYLVPVLCRRKRLSRLSLSGNKIDLTGCKLIKTMLENQESNLEELDLSHNAIDNEAAVVLAKSLATNTRLKQLHLHMNTRITTAWSSMLWRLLKVFHTLNNLGTFSSEEIGAIGRNIGVEKANRLHIYLQINGEGNKKAARKLKERLNELGKHVQGMTYLGDYSIATVTMPRILAWLGNIPFPNDEFGVVMRHTKSWLENRPLPRSELNAMRLDSIYRIVVSRPDLFC